MDAALKTSIFPYPHVLFGIAPVAASAIAVEVRSDLICEAVRFFEICRSNALAPATCGAAMLVPWVRRCFASGMVFGIDVNVADWTEAESAEEIP